MNRTSCNYTKFLLYSLARNLITVRWIACTTSCSGLGFGDAPDATGATISESKPGGILLTTRSEISGKRIEQEFGVVTGCSVHARSFFHDIMSRLVGFFGGEAMAYSELVTMTTKDAAGAMMRAAEKAGANAVIAVKFDFSATSDPTAGVFCWAACIGTAVRLEESRAA